MTGITDRGIMGRMRGRSSLPMLLAAMLCLPAGADAAPSRAGKKPARRAVATAVRAGAITGTVTIRGKIKRVRKAFNPYGDVYGGFPEKKDPPPAHLCVYLEEVPGKWAAPAAHAVLDQRDREFTTDLLPILPGTAVDFTNHDSIFHNVFSYSKPNEFDLGRRGGGETVTRIFDRLPPKGIGVVAANCEIHSNMKATILVMRNPFWAVLPEAGGAFRMDGVPPGTYRLNGWHASLTPRPLSVTVKPGATVTVACEMQGEE